MDYNDTLEWLFTQLPAFHRVGADAYKPGLERVTELARLYGDPHAHLTCIHVGGTNGKGSTAHTLAAILQSQGYKVGLFTSPHLLDFRERIRVNGQMITEAEVMEFVESARSLTACLKPSFFELTTVMAFDHFRRCGVDFAVIEVGLGGRLDSTNIITPDLSVITNISLDHTALLGATEVAIASEKAGIIKPGVPVVIGESGGVVRECFLARARSCASDITFADDSDELVSYRPSDEAICYHTRTFGQITGELTGDCQVSNTRTVLEAVKQLRKRGFCIETQAVTRGFSSVRSLTGLMGRWTRLSDSPLTICDTGHNIGGWRYIACQLERHSCRKHIVIGFVNDKDVSAVLSLLRGIDNAVYYFTQPDTPRRLPAEELRAIAIDNGLCGVCFENVAQAYDKALADVVDKGNEMIFVGGSNFVVADLLKASFNS